MKLPGILKYIGLFLLICLFMAISWIIVSAVLFSGKLLSTVANKSTDESRRIANRQLGDRANQIGKAFS
jgi:hypothetical protein